MKVTGFSFTRNAIRNDHPISQAIRSILPLIDDFVVAVGDTDGEAVLLIRQPKSHKVRIVETSRGCKWTGRGAPELTESIGH